MIATVIKKTFPPPFVCFTSPPEYFLVLTEHTWGNPKKKSRKRGCRPGIQVQIRRASGLEIHRLDGRLHRFDCRLLSRLWLEIHPHSHCSLGSSHVILWILSIAALPLWPWVLHCQTSGWSRGTLGNLVNGQGLCQSHCGHLMWNLHCRIALLNIRSITNQSLFLNELFTGKKHRFWLFLKETWQIIGEFIHLHNCAMLAAPIRLFILYY